MLVVTAETAQAVVDALAPDVPHPINVMDVSGLIVASTDPARIGQLHEGARLALETGRAVVVEVDGAAQRRGVNVPIEVDGHLIGVVGLTGPPVEVTPMARLVRRSVTMALQERARERARSERQNRRDLFVLRLTTHHGTYPEQIVADAREFGLQLGRSLAVVLVFGGGPALPRLRGVLSLAPRFDGFVAENEAALDRGVAAVLAAQAAARFVVGPFRAEVAESLQLAREAAGVAAALGLTAVSVRYSEVAVLCTLVRAHAWGSAVEVLRDHPDLDQTLRALIRADGDLQVTAGDLHIHRNTLAYRLNRIEELTGQNPRRPLVLVELVAGLLGSGTVTR